MKIAISGKGGVGKSTVSAFVVGALADRGRRVLAIDADPSPHLARLLDFPGAEEIRPIAEMTDLLRERSERDGPFYRLNPKVDDLPGRFMRRRGNVALMVLGAIQQGGAGCACADNAVLRNLLNTLLFAPDEDVVLDMEAGVEHLGRGTVAGVDRLLVVVQPYRGSLETARKIQGLAADLGLSHLGFVANQVRGEGDLDFVRGELGMDPVGVFPASDAVREAERAGRPVWEADSALREAAARLLDGLGA
ncbi:P-loop NTPase [Dissulfurirhabdus thermomarina]|uniref:P-loop NTPase n=1 Tax=Dissulfurirhabdus thermomarina TaxID=1765737 RepID=A0A6N9TV23_DISTH|nr:P-loop NTPase [Dissulfurirhabdus thermomarina]NDY42356.1 P-loop NTPase [Dissulfurirhabdus thermomarina]NMX23016.1 P-loop NTPase [Dissulfurirhabdus thermomarina]